jgi:hypothetical protein
VVPSGVTLAMSYPGSVVGGYVIAAAGLAGYLLHLRYRIRRARARAAALAAKRAG